MLDIDFKVLHDSTESILTYSIYIAECSEKNARHSVLGVLLT